MADVNLPSISDLGQMEFMSPAAYLQAQDQIRLANMFQQQNLQMGAQDLAAKSLANEFARAANPLRLEQSRLANQGTGLENIIKGVNARDAMALEGESREAKRRKFLAEASEADLKRLYSDAQRTLMDPSASPDAQRMAKNKLESSWGELQNRQKHQDKLEEIRELGNIRKEVAGEKNETQREVEKMRTERALEVARMRAAAGKQGGDLWGNVLSGKVKPDAAAVAFNSKAMLETDPELQKQYAEAARQMDIMAQRLRAAQGGKVDMSEFVKTNPFASNLGTQAGAMASVAPESPTKVSPNQQQIRDNDVKAVLQQEYNKKLEDVQRLMTVPGSDPAELRRTLGDIESLTKELARAGVKVPAAPLAKPTAPKQPVAPAGRIIVYKNGMAVATVPEAQAEQAVREGYSLKP